MNLLQNPNKRRWYIVATIFVAIICNYLDRQLLSILKPEILTHFGIEDLQYAWIVNVFLICYAIMYPISGILVDRFGSKKVMLGGIVAWSLACIGGGLSTNVVEFTICRGILGLAEPTIFAGQIVAVTLWFEKRHRATANSLCTAGGSLGTVIAPLVIAWMARFLPWHDVFIVAGLVGLVIAVAWALIYKNPPQEVLAVTMAPDKDEVARNNGEQQRAFTWGELWTTRSLWGVLLIRLISDPVWYFCCFWLPGYLRSMGEAQGLSQQATLDMIQYIGGLPFLFGAVGGILTSVWSDWLVRRGMPALKARKTMMILMAFVAPLCILTPYVSEWQAVSFDARIGLVVAIFSLIAIMCLSWLYTICVVIAEAFPVKNVASVVGITAGGSRGRRGVQHFHRFAAGDDGQRAVRRHGRDAPRNGRYPVAHGTPRNSENRKINLKHCKYGKSENNDYGTPAGDSGSRRSGRARRGRRPCGHHGRTCGGRQGPARHADRKPRLSGRQPDHRSADSGLPWTQRQPDYQRTAPALHRPPACAGRRRRTPSLQAPCEPDDHRPRRGEDRGAGDAAGGRRRSAVVRILRGRR